MASEFNLDQPQGEFNAFPSFRNTDYSAEIQAAVIALHSARTGTPIEEVRAEVARLGDIFQSSNARSDATVEVNNRFQVEVEQAVEAGSMAGAIDADTNRAIRQEVVDNTEVPEVVAQSTYDEIRTRNLSRELGTAKIIDEFLQAAEPTTLSIIGDVLDIMFSSLPDALIGGSFSRNAAARELRALRSSPISDEAYYKRVREVLTEADDAGWLQNTNFLMLSGMSANIHEGGTGLESKFEIAGFAAELAFLPSTIGFLRSTTRLTSLFRGPRAAERVLGDAHSNPGTSAANAADVPGMTATGVNRHPVGNNTQHAWVANGADVAQEAQTQNRFLQAMKSLPFFKTIDPQLIEAFKPIGAQKLRDQVEPKFRRRLLDVFVDTDNSSNIFGTITYGNGNGVPFTRLRDAERLAERLGPDAKVLPPINRGGVDYYQVSQAKNLSGVGLVDPLDANEIGNSFFRVFGGAFLSIPRRLDALAKGGEATLTNVARDIGPILKKAIKDVNTGEVQLVEKVFYELRDGQRLSHRRIAMSVPEFRTEWAIHSSTPPSRAAEELYTTIQELNDALYFLKADIIFKQVVEEGTEVLQFSVARKSGDIDRWSLLAKPANKDDLAPTTKVYHLETGAEVSVDELSKTTSVFITQGGYQVGQKTYRHVATTSPKVRRVYHSDVLGYNPGGSRGYAALNHYLKQENFIDLVGEGSVRARDRTFMGTATRAEALTAAEQVNTIFKAFREAIPNLASLSKAEAIEAIRALARQEGVESVIRTNAAWNTKITGVDDMIDFMLKQKLDPRVNVGVAGSEDALAVLDNANRPIFGGRVGETYGGRFESSINRPLNRATSPRRDDPLIGFGGDYAETLSPIDMIQNDLIRATHNIAYSAYNFRTVRGWLAGANDFISDKSKMRGINPLADMKAAEFGTAPGAEARSYMAARDAILRTLGAKTEAEVKWNSFIDRISEFVYGKGKVGRRISKVLRNPGIAKSPLEFLRSLTFDARLGLLDPGQMIVQASQTWNILAIIGPLKVGTWLQAAATHVPLRMAMMTSDPKNWAEIGRRSGAAIGMTADEFVEFARFTHQLGRLNVGTEVAELSGASFELAQSKWKQARNLTRVFFNEGEKMPRSAALSVAWKEYKGKFPGGDPFSDAGQRWIIFRQDALTAAMTSKSAAAWQRGPMSVPLQFMTYSSRMLESLLTDRLLTGKERGRLAIAQIVFWGAAGIGGGSLLDAYTTEGGLTWLGIGPEDTVNPEYQLLRTGALDAALQWSTGTHAAFGGRLAMAEGFGDLIENVSDGEFVEIIGGPAGQLIGDVGSVLLAGFGDIVAGRTSLIESDLKKLFRNLTGPNKLYNAWTIYTVGDYLSRQDDVIVGGLSKLDGLLALAGAQINLVNQTYSRQEVFRDQDQSLKRHGARIADMMKVMKQKIRDGDDEGAAAVQRDIQSLNGILPAHQRTRVLPMFMPELRSTYEETYHKLVVERGGALLQAASENTPIEGE